LNIAPLLYMRASINLILVRHRLELRLVAIGLRAN